MNSDAIQTALNRLATKLGSAGAIISNLARLSGGASQETWRFDLQSPQPRSFILRRSPFDGPRNETALSQKTEAAIMALVQQHGVDVPKIAYVCEPEDGLGDAFIMDFCEGETIARKILRDARFEVARAGLAAQCGNQLARIHQTPITTMDSQLVRSDGLDQLARYEAIYRGFGVNRPVIELAFSWLKSTPPEPQPLCLVHGDFRLGNLIVTPDGLSAILDWELAHIGDPREDLGWICVNSWRFGVRKKAVGGFGSRGELLDGYSQGGGPSFAPADIMWFQALGSLKWGIMCLMMYDAFARGADRTIERAMIGRRTSEAEFDLLNLMEGLPDA